LIHSELREMINLIDRHFAFSLQEKFSFEFSNDDLSPSLIEKTYWQVKGYHDLPNKLFHYKLKIKDLQLFKKI
jgi:hypothetical protein